jgi:hypothetical protein
VLASYNPEGEELFVSNSVEGHWYQWDGFYVVLYRGFDASSGVAMCPGNSINVEGEGWIFVSNSPHVGDAGEVCVGATVADGAAMSCDSFLYYVTLIPTSEQGSLYGSLELSDGAGWAGHTSEAIADLPSTPEFEPGLDAYSLPSTTVDDLETVICS